MEDEAVVKEEEEGGGGADSDDAGGDSAAQEDAEAEGKEERKDETFDAHGRKPIMFTDEELKANLDRVQFTPAVAKQIISKHSGSILVKAEPEITLSPAMIDNATRIFNDCIRKEEEGAAAAGMGGGMGGGGGQEPAEEQTSSEPARKTVSKSKLLSLMAECGFTADRVETISERMYTGPEDMELTDFIGFLTHFYAPSFYFGQRLRRFVGRNEMDAVFDLLARGCDVNTGDGEGLCPLHYAAMFNRPSAVRELVAYAPDTIVIDAVDRYGWSPLHCACQHGNADCVVQLLNAGANVRVADKNGKTPLHVAACQARNAIVNILLEHDSGIINIQDNRGMTAMHDAAFKGHDNTCHVLCGALGADLQVMDILGNTYANYLSIGETERHSLQQGGESKH